MSPSQGATEFVSLLSEEFSALTGFPEERAADRGVMANLHVCRQCLSKSVQSQGQDHVRLACICAPPILVLQDL